MLHRTAALLLTDVRTKDDSNYTQTVAPRSIDGTSVLTIPYTPLLLSANVLRLWESFKTDVINIAASTIFRGSTNPHGLRPRNVNWSKTCESFATGQNQYILTESTSSGKNKNWLFLENIIKEYYMHIHLLNDFLKTQATRQPSSFIQVSRKIKKLEIEFNKIFEDLSHTAKQFSLKKMVFPKKEKEAFRNFINSNGGDTTTLYSKYLEISAQSFKLSREHSFLCERPQKWRQKYIELETGLGVGKELLINPSTAPPRLFEMWCFYEFVNILCHTKGIGIAQKCFIQPNQDLELFSADNIGQFYYNFRGKKHRFDQMKSSRNSKILKRTCVEWYMELDDGMQIVFDTKYKKWSSIDNLQVLGYMTDFNADIGIIIFSEELKLNNYSSPIIQKDRIIAVEFDNGKKFIALSLTPSKEYEAVNKRAINELVEILFK